jgi:hypothetical protein
MWGTSFPGHCTAACALSSGWLWNSKMLNTVFPFMYQNGSSNFVLVMNNVQWDPTFRGLNYTLWQPYEQTLHFKMYSWHAIIQWIIVWWDQSNVHWKSKHINSKSQQWIWIIPGTTIRRMLCNRLHFRYCIWFQKKRWKGMALYVGFYCLRGRWNTWHIPHLQQW